MATIGEQRVRLSFNPGGNPIVHAFKVRTAELIDSCEALKVLNQEAADSANQAQLYYELAAMLAVKAATAEPPTVEIIPQETLGKENGGL